MHPRSFFETFWRNDLRDEIFVAMPFREDFEKRWTSIIQPAIEAEPICGEVFDAVRVDVRQSGESILTDITDGIAHSQLVIADISVTDRWTDEGGDRFSRNGNVMYEVGIAVAARQPVELLLIRNDSERLLFDVSSIPVLTIDFDHADSGIKQLRAAIEDRLKERNLQMDMRLSRIRDSLMSSEVGIMISHRKYEKFWWNGTSLPAGVAMGLPRLLDKGVVRLVEPPTGERSAVYTWTTFGRVVAESFIDVPEDSI